MFESTHKSRKIKQINEHTYEIHDWDRFKEIEKHLFIYDYGGAPAIAVKDAEQGKKKKLH